MSASDLGIPSAQPGAPAMAPPMNILPDAVRGSTVDASGTRSFAPSGPDNRSWNDVAGRLFDFFNSPDAPRMLMAMAGGFGGARSLGEGLGRAASNTAAVMSRLDKLDAPQLKQIDTDRQGQPIFAWVNPRTQHITPIAGR